MAVPSQWRSTPAAQKTVHISRLLLWLLALCYVSGCAQVFYGFGAAGLLWSSWWESVVSAMAEEDPEAHRLLTETAATREASRAEPEQAMPWRAFLRNGPMRALAYTHFCNNWCALAARPQPFTCILSRPCAPATHADAVGHARLLARQSREIPGAATTPCVQAEVLAHGRLVSLWGLQLHLMCKPEHHRQIADCE